MFYARWVEEGRGRGEGGEGGKMQATVRAVGVHESLLSAGFRIKFAPADTRLETTFPFFFNDCQTSGYLIRIPKNKCAGRGTAPNRALCGPILFNGSEREPPNEPPKTSRIIMIRALMVCKKCLEIYSSLGALSGLAMMNTQESFTSLVLRSLSLFYCSCLASSFKNMLGPM